LRPYRIRASSVAVTQICSPLVNSIRGRLRGEAADRDRAGILHGHIAWHAALGALERGDTEKVLSIYA